MSFNQGHTKMKESDENKTKSTPVAMVAPELKQNADDTEITKTCAVLGCEESKNLNSDSFFRFPEDANLRQIWTDLTGRNNWTPTDYSYICVQHFSVDCFECEPDNTVVLMSKAVPSLKLPNHVLEVEYIEEETFDHEDGDEYEDYDMNEDIECSDMEQDTFENGTHVMNGNISNDVKGESNKDNGVTSTKGLDIQKKNYDATSTNGLDVQKKDNGVTSTKDLDVQEKDNVATSTEDIDVQEKENGATSTKDLDLQKETNSETLKRTLDPQNEVQNIEILKLFTEVQRMQRQAVVLKDKLKSNMKIYNRQNKFLLRMKEAIDMKKSILNQKRKKKSRILLSLQDKIREDTNGLVLAMPMRHTDDLKNFSLSIYKYSPQAYIYVRNTLRTMLPSTDVLESWLSAGYEPKNVLSSSNLIKVVADQSDSELSCKVSLG